MEFRRTSAPITRAAKLTVMPLIDVKEHIRIAHDFEDRMLEGFVGTAYDFLSGPDGWLGHCCLLPESFECFAKDFSEDIELPMRPLMSGGLQTVDVVDDSGIYGPADPTRWRLAETYPFSNITNYMGETLTAVRRTGFSTWDPLAYRIQFVVGFGPTADDIPEPIKQAMKMLVAHWYQNREQTFADTRISTVNRQVEFGLMALAGRYRVEPDHS